MDNGCHFHSLVESGDSLDDFGVRFSLGTNEEFVRLGVLFGEDIGADLQVRFEVGKDVLWNGHGTDILVAGFVFRHVDDVEDFFSHTHSPSSRQFLYKHILADTGPLSLIQTDPCSKELVNER